MPNVIFYSISGLLHTREKAHQLLRHVPRDKSLKVKYLGPKILEARRNTHPWTKEISIMFGAKEVHLTHHLLSSSVVTRHIFVDGNKLLYIGDGR
jgi:hypothetical protein